jgi:sugar lactone lactonase YvrE
MNISIDDIEIFADGLDHPECVAVHPDGSVWAGGEAGQIYKVSPDGLEIKEIANTHGFILGIAFSPDVSWLAICDMKNHCVWKLALANYELTKFATGAENVLFNIPNYPCFSKDGKLWVSESGAFRQTTGKIFYFDQNGNGKIWHSGPFNFANGIALSLNEDWLYVACTWLPGVERIAIHSDGTVGKREVYCSLPRSCPDGLAFDTDQNLYVSCYSPNYIYKITPKQEVHLLIDDWEAHGLCNPTNLAFGGKNFNELYTANLGAWHISKIKLNAIGQKLACHL